MAFGLYHNLSSGLHEAVSETFRVLEKDGLVCASFRADNFQTRLSDWLVDKTKSRRIDDNHTKIFHKLNLTKSEFRKLFEDAGFKVEQIRSVQNMPLLYKFRVFRARNHKEFNEKLAREEGYKLSIFGNFIQKALMKAFPDQLCNLYVIFARRPLD